MYKKYSKLKKELKDVMYYDIKLINGDIVEKLDPKTIKIMRTGAEYHYYNGESKEKLFYETILFDGTRYEIDASEKDKLSKLLKAFKVKEFVIEK